MGQHFEKQMYKQFDCLVNNFVRQYELQLQNYVTLRVFFVKF